MKGIVPEEILTRTFKVGIAAPFKDWLSKYLKDWALQNMKKDNFVLACEIQKINPDSLIKALEDNELDTAMANQIWLGLNFALIDT